MALSGSFSLFAVCCLVAVSLTVSESNLAAQLRNYDVLHHSNIKVSHRQKRSATGVTEKDVNLDVLGKHFELHLYPQRDLFSKYFRAYQVDDKNVKHLFKLDKSQFLEGKVKGIKGIKNRVVAYFEENNLMATIETDDDTFVIEPSWRHLPKSKNHSMIAYKKSDMKFDPSNAKNEKGASFCGFVHADGVDDAAYHPKDIRKFKDLLGLKSQHTHDKVISDHSSRTKRQASAKTVCTLLLVADYHFVTNVGQGKISSAAAYMVGQVQKTNIIYKATNFKGYTGLGFEVKSMKLYSSPTDTSGHHNSATNSWVPKTLLKAFAQDSDNAAVCLSHLYTDISFSDGVLGLAWIAGSTVGSVGGMCSPTAGGYYYNTAFTTLSDQTGARVLTEMAQIVTTHEFGHNWGSQHDPATTECDPGSRSGGSFIMQSKSVAGTESNNKLFSPCSIRSMAEVLANKKETCFTEKSQFFCGNLIVESPYEQCDAGPDGAAGNDPCCDSTCQLKTGATCSDKNSLCCENCKASASGKLCRDNGALNTTCEGNGNCDGTTFDCPVSTNKPDGTVCVDDGVCKNGVCEDLCGQVNLLPCICDALAQACLTCCTNATNGFCNPYQDNKGAFDFISDGKPCKQGYCTAGVCTKVIGQFTDRLWSIITNIEIDALAVFMKNNLVLTCIVLSLVLYIPCAVIIGIVDWRRDVSEKDEDSWYSKTNTSLYMEKDTKQIRRTFTRKKPVTRVEGSANSRGTRNRIYPQL